MHAHACPSRRSQIPVSVLEQRWGYAEADLKAQFPRVPQALWDELRGLTVRGDHHRVHIANDHLVHAYLLAQMFALVVMNLINRHVGIIPVHARLGCVGESHGISIAVEGLNQVDRNEAEDDFLAHAEAEARKFRAVGLIH